MTTDLKAQRLTRKLATARRLLATDPKLSQALHAIHRRAGVINQGFVIKRQDSGEAAGVTVSPNHNNTDCQFLWAGTGRSCWYPMGQSHLVEPTEFKA